MLSAALAQGGCAAPGCGAAHLGLRLRDLHFLDVDLERDAPQGDPAVLDLLERVERDRAQALGPADWSALDPGRTATAPPVGSGPGGAAGLPRRLANCATLSMARGPWELAGLAVGGGGPEGPHGGRAWLILARLDLDLHTGRCGAEAGIERLCGAACPAAAADALLTRVVRHPGDALAAVLGWHLLGASDGPSGSVTAAATGASHPPAGLSGLEALPVPLALRYACKSAMLPG